VPRRRAYRTTDVVETFFTRVDVTEQFPFPVAKLSPYTEPPDRRAMHAQRRK
jgi:hypothetical protein